MSLIFELHRAFTRLGWRVPTLVVTLFGLLAGCAGFDAQQRKWIFQAATVPVSVDPRPQRADGRRHGRRLDRARIAAQRPADPPARAVARAIPTTMRRSCCTCMARGATSKAACSGSAR
jgi:hypothetical protein